MADAPLPDVQVTANAPSSPTVSTLQTPFAVRKIDLTFTLGTGSFGNTGADQLTITGLRVYAQLRSVVFPHGGTEITMRVHGMTLDHINSLSKAGLLWDTRQNQVQVKAGDASSGMTTVFDGNIVEAYPAFDGGADDRHFYIYAVDSAIHRLKPAQPTSYPKSVPATQVLKSLAEQAGLTLQASDVTSVLQTPYFWGTLWQQIRSAVAAADCFAWLDGVNKTLIVWPKNSKTVPSATVTISPATGMIGYPMFQAKTIIVRTLFNPTLTIGLGTSVLIRSELAAANNAKLRIADLSHNLASQLPGGPWETTIFGVAPPVGSQ